MSPWGLKPGLVPLLSWRVVRGGLMRIAGIAASGATGGESAVRTARGVSHRFNTNMWQHKRKQKSPMGKRALRHWLLQEAAGEANQVLWLESNPAGQPSQGPCTSSLPVPRSAAGLLP